MFNLYYGVIQHDGTKIHVSNTIPDNYYHNSVCVTFNDSVLKFETMLHPRIKFLKKNPNYLSRYNNVAILKPGRPIGLRSTSNTDGST